MTLVMTLGGLIVYIQWEEASPVRPLSCPDQDVCSAVSPAGVSPTFAPCPTATSSSSKPSWGIALSKGTMNILCSTERKKTWFKPHNYSTFNKKKSGIVWIKVICITDDQALQFFLQLPSLVKFSVKKYMVLVNIFCSLLSLIISSHIWVSFDRTGIGPELCIFFKFEKLLWPNQKRKPCFFNSLWDIFLLGLLG